MASAYAQLLPAVSHRHVTQRLSLALHNATPSDIADTNALSLLAAERDDRAEYRGPYLIVDNTAAEEVAP